MPSLVAVPTTGSTGSSPILISYPSHARPRSRRCGIVAALTRRKSLAFALVFAIGMAFGGGSIVLEHPAPIAPAVAVGLVLLSSLASGCLLDRTGTPGPGVGIALLATVPAAGLLAGRASSGVLAVAVACALPLLAALAFKLVLHGIGRA